MYVPLMGRKEATDSFWGVRNPQNSTRVTPNGSRAEGGGGGKGEGEPDAGGGSIVAIGSKNCTSTQCTVELVVVYIQQMTIRAG